MSHSAKKDNLTDRHYVTLILRLTFDQEGQLSDGELTDTVGSLTKRFRSRVGLDRAIDGSLNQLAESFTTATGRLKSKDAPKGDSEGNYD